MRLVFFLLCLSYYIQGYSQLSPPSGIVAIKKDTDVAFLCTPQPEYPGGEAAMVNFLSSNLIYPDFAKENGIEGRVFVKFAIDENGKPVDFVILKGMSKDLNAEAIRVMKLLPSFKPATINGSPVKTSLVIPIDFKLNNTSVVISKAPPPRVNVAPVYDVADRMPEFPGGDDSLRAFVSRNLEYPTTDPPIYGRVVISFVVNEDGSLSDATIKRKLSPPYDEEILRLVSLFPKFLPGRQGERIVRVRYVLPISFGLSVR